MTASSTGVREITRRHGVLLVIDETHTLCAGPGGCTRRLGARARLRGGRQADRWRRAVRGVRHDRGDRRPAVRPDARARDRRRRGRRHPHRQRPGPRSDPGDAVDLPARGGLRRRRSRWPSGSPRASPSDRPSTTCPGTCSASAAARSTGSARLPATEPPRPRPSTRSSRLPAPVVAQPRRPAHAVPQHGAVQPAPHRADVDRHTEVFAEAVAGSARLKPGEARRLRLP